MHGTLYLIATPIGNLQDISLRALEILKAVDIVACEDTRHTGRLLKHFGISKKLISYHEHNESKRADEILEFIETGSSVAVVSDAGTPGISDPGFRLVQTAIEKGATIISVPGPVAFISAAIVSGLPTDSLFFGGFLPSKKRDRKKRLKELANVPATLCFYEAPHRLVKSLADCEEVFGNRKAAVARELTKLHEEILRGNLDELRNEFVDRKPKGEIVVLIDRERPETIAVGDDPAKSVADRVSELVKEGLDQKRALKKASKEFGISKSEAYRMLQEEKAD